MKNLMKLFLFIPMLFAFTAKAQLPVGAFLGSDYLVCPGGTGLGFSGNEVGFNPNWTYLWSTGETTSQIFYSYGNAGVYTVWCKVSLNGQSSTDTVKFTVHPPVSVPVITSTATSPCVDIATLSTPFVNGHTYQWYKSDPNNNGNFIIINGATNNTLVVTNTDEYRLKVTNQGGCYEYNNIQVSTLGKPKQYLHDTSFCSTNGSNFSIVDNVNANCTYLWNQGNTGNQWVINPSQVGTTTYWVTITNANGCSTMDTITTTIHPAPNPFLNGDQYTCGDNVVLKDYNTSYDHVWKFGNNVISTADSAIVNYTGTFTVKTSNNFGCSVTNTLHVYQSATVNVDGFNFIPQLPDHPRKFNFQPIGTVNVNTYEWNFGDGASSNQMYPVHEFTNDDTTSIVTLTVSNSNFNGECKSKTISLRINTAGVVDTTDNPPTTGISELDNNYNVSVYPNPATNYVKIKLVKGKINNVTLTDVTGRVLSLNTGDQIDMTSIPSGIYIIKVDITDGKNEGTITRKVMKK